MADKEDLKKEVERQAARIKKAEIDRPTLIAQTMYLGVLGVVFILPVIAGAYLGQWLDEHQAMDYSISWSVSLILLGVLVGAVNVYLMIRKA
ncbi:MAG: AtpZ/AtpI family protein [Pseudomonadota bacterium]